MQGAGNHPAMTEPKLKVPMEVRLEEAARLKAIWDKTEAERRQAGVGTQGAFGDTFGIGNQAAVGFFLNGKTALSLKAAHGFATGLKCKIEDFSPRLAKLAFEDMRADLHLSPDALNFARLFDQLTPEGKATWRRVVNALQEPDAPA